MFNLGFSEVALLAIIALIFIGPKQLPDLARSMGRLLNELKRTTNEIGQTIASPASYVKDQLNKEIHQIQDQIHGRKTPVESADQAELEHDLHQSLADHQEVSSDQLEFDTNEQQHDAIVSDEHKKNS